MRKNGGRFIDMSGQIIENALVLDVNDDYVKEHNLNDKAIYWNCKCRLCGSIFIREGRKLRARGSKGCPNCIKKITSQRETDNLLGQIFNDIKVIERADNYKKEHNLMGNDVFWKCQCLNCGVIFYNRGQSIKNREKPGCPTCYNSKKSFGEIKIENILKENNINYIYNKSYFPDLKSEKKMSLRYDFILLNEKAEPFRLIEFDGRQHFITADYFGGEEGLKSRQNADKLKNIYALTHNIPLVRIRYDEEKLINKENILFSQEYLVIDENGKRYKDEGAH